ncbi:hypothetical protein ANCDUO_24185 [Ancylostoma duodenale]|uniref:Peptidase M12A domain-containing protein n=1 Tax=Ancylostoma duodenale TaxID=51022 RepID=A0A0C2FGD3_9BILA|nr:hypothetical protein ANCDUO_24185 [Ancylostoma duodenale]
MPDDSLAPFRDLAEEIEEDINEEVGEGNRTKRQAYRDRRYPATLWANGVNYYFDYNASPQVKSVFRKGVKEWEKYTCINFKEDSTAYAYQQYQTIVLQFTNAKLCSFQPPTDFESSPKKDVGRT